jgi:hypothetical protein
LRRDCYRPQSHTHRRPAHALHGSSQCDSVPDCVVLRTPIGLAPAWCSGCSQTAGRAVGGGREARGGGCLFDGSDVVPVGLMIHLVDAWVSVPAYSYVQCEAVSRTGLSSWTCQRSVGGCLDEPRARCRGRSRTSPWSTLGQAANSCCSAIGVRSSVATCRCSESSRICRSDSKRVCHDASWGTGGQPARRETPVSDLSIRIVL